MVPITDIEAAVAGMAQTAPDLRRAAAERDMRRSREDWEAQVSRQYQREAAARAEMWAQFRNAPLPANQFSIQDGWTNGYPGPPVDNVYTSGIPAIQAYGGTFGDTAGTFANPDGIYGNGTVAMTAPGGNYTYYSADAIRAAGELFANAGITGVAPPCVLAERKAAEAKAEQLLEDTIPEDEYRHLVEPDFPENRYIQVTGKSWIYRIRRRFQTLVCCEKGTHGTACLQLTDRHAPDQDRIVAEYILLKNNESYYLKTANITWAGH